MLKVGHRGARAYEPENTLRSFQKAIELGADAIELDVRKSKDDYIVVIHDDNIEKTTNGEGLVSNLTLNQIKSYSANKNEKIPTFEEALDFIGNRVKVFVELKELGLEEKVLDIIYRKGLENSVVIVSFLEGVLKRTRELDAKVEIGLVYAKHKNPIKAALELKAQFLLGFYRFVHTTNVQKAHENGIKIIVWTINSAQEVADFKEKGVDGIASDKPDIL